MAYFRHLIALLITCGVQYACSYGLIVLGYYFNWLYFAGGFVIWFIIFFTISNFLCNLFTKKDKDKKQNKQLDLSQQIMVIVMLVATYFVNDELYKIHDPYEYANYGETKKVAVSKKYVSNGKSDLHYVVFDFMRNNQKITREVCVKREEYPKINLGDSVTIIYSTRNNSLTQKFTKIIP